ncbi:MAG: ArnT family glycosyltransferase, partial [Terriglobales bacterium]
MSERRKLVMELVTLAAFCAFLFFFGLGSFGLTGPDEPRYAQVAREMIERQDWVTPTLYGKPWLEKPVLYYWQARVAFAVFGVADWTARLPGAAFAALLVAAAYAFMRRFRPGGQLEAALITASSAGVLGFGRGASTDMQIAAPFAAGMMAWYAWLEGGRKLWLAAFYALMGVATLAKGPVAPLLAALGIGVFAALRREPAMIRRTLWLPGVALYLAVALPWYVAVQLRNPEFFRVFILEHNLARFSSDLYLHRQPFWYFAPVLLLAMAPWTAFAAAAVASVVRRWRAWASPEETLPVFLLSWGMAPVAFFSLSQSKLPGYILPAVPAFALLVAEYVQRRQRVESAPGWALLAAHAGLLGLLTVAALLFPYFLERPRLPVPGWMAAAAGALGALVTAAVLVSLRRQGLVILRFVTLAPVIVILAYVLRVEAPILDQAISARPVARDLDRLGTEKSVVAVYRAHRSLEYGLAFYRNRPVPRYERDHAPEGEH